MATTVRWRQSPVNCFFDQFWHQSAPMGLWAFMWRQRGRFLSLWMLTTPLSPGLMRGINIILLLILNCLWQPMRDRPSTPDTGASEVTAAAEVKDNTMKAAGGQFNMQIWFHLIHFVIYSISPSIGEFSCLTAPNPLRLLCVFMRYMISFSLCSSKLSCRSKE